MTQPQNNDCPICGQPIPERPRGSRHGHPPKTCSVECRKERKNRIEKARYARIKDTEHFKSVRAAHLGKLRARLASDPEFYEEFRAYSASRLRSWRAEVAKDPERREEMVAARRAGYAAWRKEMETSPAALEAYREKCREWYASLTPEDRERIYYAPRRKREAARRDE